MALIVSQEAQKALQYYIPDITIEEIANYITRRNDKVEFTDVSYQGTGSPAVGSAGVSWEDYSKFDPSILIHWIIFEAVEIKGRPSITGTYRLTLTLAPKFDSSGFTFQTRYSDIFNENSLRELVNKLNVLANFEVEQK